MVTDDFAHNFPAANEILSLAAVPSDQHHFHCRAGRSRVVSTQQPLPPQQLASLHWDCLATLQLFHPFAAKESDILKATTNS